MQSSYYFNNNPLKIPKRSSFFQEIIILLKTGASLFSLNRKIYKNCNLPVII